MNTSDTIQVVCAIIIKDNKIVIAQRSEYMRLPLKWEFPGGKVEEKESEEECLHREIMEELNISIQVKYKLNNSIYQYADYKICLIPFVVDYLGGIITLKEHKQFKLVSKRELQQYDFAEADIPIILSFLNTQ